ncbi:hypothetical protein ACP4OV_012303 [Aristida adscensionis]
MWMVAASPAAEPCSSLLQAALSSTRSGLSLGVRRTCVAAAIFLTGGFKRIGYNDISVAEGGGSIGYSAVFLPHRRLSIHRSLRNDTFLAEKNVRFPFSLWFPVFHQNVLSFGASRFACPCLVCILLLLRKLKMQCFLELELELAGTDFHIPRSQRDISISCTTWCHQYLDTLGKAHIAACSSPRLLFSPKTRRVGWFGRFPIELKTAITHANSRSNMATIRDALEVSAEMYRKDPNNVPDYVQRHLLSLSVWEELR